MPSDGLRAEDRLRRVGAADGDGGDASVLRLSSELPSDDSPPCADAGGMVPRGDPFLGVSGHEVRDEAVLSGLL